MHHRTLTQWVLLSLFGLSLAVNAVFVGNMPGSPVTAFLASSSDKALIASVSPKSTVMDSADNIYVPLHHDERALILTGTVDRKQPMSFILDTGATYTTISRETALKLGYDLTHAPKITITTANGQVVIPKITLKSLTFNGYTAHNVEATVMDLPKHVPFSGLLGLTFVKRHRLTIDAQAEHLMLEPQLTASR